MRTYTADFIGKFNHVVFHRYFCLTTANLILLSAYIEYLPNLNFFGISEVTKALFRKKFLSGGTTLNK